MTKRFVIGTLLACALAGAAVVGTMGELAKRTAGILTSDVDVNPITLIAESDDGYVGVYEYCDAKLDKYTIISGGWIYVEKEVGGCIILKDSH